jgi:hypothetical protein
MVFIELARVSEIPAPYKFDRSILKLIDLLFQHFKKSSFSMYFCLENCHFSLIALQNAKILKLIKTLESNKAKGLTNVN